MHIISYILSLILMFLLGSFAGFILMAVCVASGREQKMYDEKELNNIGDDIANDESN